VLVGVRVRACVRARVSSQFVFAMTSVMYVHRTSARVDLQAADPPGACRGLSSLCCCAVLCSERTNHVGPAAADSAPSRVVGRQISDLSADSQLCVSFCGCISCAPRCPSRGPAGRLAGRKEAVSRPGLYFAVTGAVVRYWPPPPSSLGRRCTLCGERFLSAPLLLSWLARLSVPRLFC
jgi:hypothetical protein